MGLQFNRAVSAELLHELKPGGRFHSLIQRRHDLMWVADVQTRRGQGPESHASLYIGLTSVLSVRERNGSFALAAHRTHRRAGGFDAAWATFRAPEGLAADWTAVDGYLDRLLAGRVDPRWYRREGVLHALLCSGAAASYGPVQREAVPWADGSPTVKDLVDAMSGAIWDAVTTAGRSDGWWPGVRDRGVRKAMGDELDVLAIDRDGRLLCIEAKPAEETAGIAWSCAQVALYSELFSRWVAEDPAAAAAALSAMAGQRAALGMLDSRWATPLAAPIRVAPVVAVGTGVRSPVALTRLAAVCASLEHVPRHPLVDPIEVWLMDPSGEPAHVWRPADGPPPVGRGMTSNVVRLLGQAPNPEAAPLTVPPAKAFVTGARNGQVRWKTSGLLPPEAIVPAPYEGRGPALEFVLPSEHRWLNLLPEAREVARSRFEAAAIVWHGDGDGPNPHLLSSQIQCLNALAPLVNQPTDLARWLGDYFPVAEVIPFGATTDSPYDATDYVVFEWQGLIDHLGEWGASPPTRGARATSMDAAIRYLTPSGAVEMALVEWKYTEAYPYGGRLSGTAFDHQRRLDRYRSLANDTDSPVRLDVGVDYEDLFAEPTYQLFRQQLLAWQIETNCELEVTRAVVVHAAPAANHALLHDSLGSHRFRQLAEREGGLIGGWRALLRRPDRFVSVDTTTLVREGSGFRPEFRARYAHLHESPAPPPSHPRPLLVADGAAVPRTMTGDQLAELPFDGDVDDIWVGRAGGLHGADLADDIANGHWRVRSYRVARGTAAPNRNWFRLHELLDRVVAAQAAARAAAGWETIGTVSTDGASVALAQPDVVLPIPVTGSPARAVILLTREDSEYPVEVRRVGDAVAEARIELVSDIDELVGTWRTVGSLDVGSGGLVAIDPSRAGGPRVAVPVGPGRWTAEVFVADGDDLALRLTPAS